MSKTAEHLYVLYNNPFILYPIIVDFYKHYEGSQKNDILLSYLIFPIVLYEESKNDLQRAEHRRVIRTFVKEKDRLYGLTRRIVEFKNLTNLSIQLAIDKKLLIVDQNLSVQVDNELFAIQERRLETYLKASANLAKMLKNTEVLAIYRQFGIKEI